MLFFSNQIDEKKNQSAVVRKNLSFYQYFLLTDLIELRDKLYFKLNQLNVLGRIYIAHEGINAQISVPENKIEQFTALVKTFPFGKSLTFQWALEEIKNSFYKLKVKVRTKIVSDGIKEKINFSQKGKKLNAEQVNAFIEKSNPLMVDVRNHYETEVGHFQQAFKIDSDTFRALIPQLIEKLSQVKNSKNKNLILYCTGGIRCEKVSSYLIQKGFKKVNQIDGGIINYINETREKNLPNYFIGKNFVFDNRLGERVTNKVIAYCHQCGQSCDEHTNCANDDCHLLFIQCIECKKKMENCCSSKCQSIIHLPIEKQRELRKGKVKENSLAIYKSRLRPKLNQNYFYKFHH